MERYRFVGKIATKNMKREYTFYSTIPRKIKIRDKTNVKNKAKVSDLSCIFVLILSQAIILFNW